MKYNFYDTSSLLIAASTLFDKPIDYQLIISSITLKELEYIKTAANKDISIKHAARVLLNKLSTINYLCINYSKDMEKYISSLDLNNDAKIIACAYDFSKCNENDFSFYTNDLAMTELAKLYFPKEMIKSVTIQQDTYTGYKDINLNDEELALLYEGHLNLPNIQINEYINIWDCRGDRVDTLCWTGSEFRPLKYKTFDSDWFGNIKPYKDDIFQAMAADSLLNNQITMLRGPSGAGKSHLALGYLFYLLEHNRIDKIIVFCNTVATRNAAKLGYYPGDKNEKLLDAQIGNMLSSKLGGHTIQEIKMKNYQMLKLVICYQVNQVDKKLFCV